MIARKFKRRPMIRPHPWRQAAEDLAGFGLRMAAWYYWREAAGYGFHELPVAKTEARAEALDCEPALVG